VRTFSYLTKRWRKILFGVCLAKDGIWHRFINGKYLPHCSVATWLRLATYRTTNASQIWKNLLKYLHIIQHWLRWKPGSGHSVLIGMDSIPGLGKSTFCHKNFLFP
jgi:hypothetical protein